MSSQHYLIPTHKGGAETDISFRTTATDTEDAEDWFIDAKDRLLDVNNWATFAHQQQFSFQLTESHLQPVSRTVRRADHLLIKTEDNTLHDAYVIDALEYDDYPDEQKETFAIRMHPTESVPDAEGYISDTATIVVERNGIHLAATYHARNSATGHTDLWHGIPASGWAAVMQGLLK